MKTIIKTEKEVDIVYLLANVQPRYWEDAHINGLQDDGSLVPCRDGLNWIIKINLETGKIENWELGITAEIRYKVCDAGLYSLLDKDMNEIIYYEGYVPDILAIEDDGYGDYIIIDIDEKGMIENWKFDSEKLNNLIENMEN